MTCCRDDAVLQGEVLLWSTGDASLRLAIIETISRFCETLAAASLCMQHPSSDMNQRRLLLSKSDAIPGALQGEDEDFS
jgi:hypothetical protein